MAVFLTFILLATLILPASATEGPTADADLTVAITQMQTANYFTFVTLIKMLKDQVPPNITFLMPNDRTLSSVSLPTSAIPDFLLRHSIPSPLVFDNLIHIPNGSIIPTRKPDYMLTVLNGGRQRYYFNNVRLMSPNICFSGSSIKCHGIDGVLEEPPPAGNTSTPSPPCVNRTNNNVCSGVAPSMSQPTARPPVPPPNLTSVTSPPPVVFDPTGRNSVSSQRLNGGVSNVIAYLVIFLIAEIKI